MDIYSSKRTDTFLFTLFVSIMLVVGTVLWSTMRLISVAIFVLVLLLGYIYFSVMYYDERYADEQD